MSLATATQGWARCLADLHPIPAERLDVLLHVCVGDGYETTRPHNAGEVLQRALPLAMFLERGQGQHSDQVVPQLIRILEELPQAWGAVQNGPLQTQADFTQLMLDLRRLMRSPAVPASTQKQLSQAVQQLLQQLFATATKQQLQQLYLPSWVKSGCNLLLRALTRSPQFVDDPVLPLLPADARDALRWLNQNAMGTLGPAAPTISRAVAGAGSNDAVPSPAAAAAAADTASDTGTGKVLLKDDKIYLLLTKLVITATGAGSTSAFNPLPPPEATLAGASVAAPPAETPLAAADTAIARTGVVWADPPTVNGAGAGAGGAGVGRGLHDPDLLYTLLEWSSTKVKQAMQRLLDSSASSEDAAPSREAATAAAQLAATCIHTLQAQGPVSPELEMKLIGQVEELLETALAVGEAAVSAASAAYEQNGDSDKVLGLGARVIASTTPFIAAAASRSSPEQQLYLTGRLQQLMLSAAQLAARNGVILPAATAVAAGPSASSGRSGIGSSAPAAGSSSGGSGLPQIAEHGPLHANGNKHDLLHQEQQAFGSKLRAGMSKLAIRRAGGSQPHPRHGRGGAAAHHGKHWQQHQQQQRQLRHQQQQLYGKLAYAQGSSVGAGADVRWGSAAPSPSPVGARAAGGLLGEWGSDGLGWDDDLTRQLLVAEAEVAVPHADLSHPWTWDVAQPLTTLTEGIKLSQLPLSCEIGGFLLARAAAEMLCEALAAAWLGGSAAPVRRLMLLPAGDAAEKVVTALAIGRLYVKLRADQTLGQLVLPLLADLLSSSNEAYEQSSTSRVMGGAAAAAAVAVVTSAGGSSMANSGSSSVASPATSAGGSAVGGISSSGGLAGNGVLVGRGCCAAEVAGAVVCSLEGMASACVQYCKDKWLYEQALQLLLMLYREPSKLSMQLLSGRSAHPATAGLLADALHLLAVGLEDAPQRARQDLRLKLLLLFSDVAARVGSSNSGVLTADLGDLLVAVAVAAEGLQPRTIRLLGSTNSSSRMSMHDIQSAQREDASTTRLFRNLWLYSAMYKLISPAAGVVIGSSNISGGGAGSSGGSATGSSVAEWQSAAGRLAAVTPLLVVGTDSYYEADMVERLKVELGEQLAQAGSLGSSSSLNAVLQSLLGGRMALEGLVLPLPSEAVLLAFIVAVALAELSRAALAPLPDLDDDPVVACPISVTMGYLKGVLPDGVAAAWTGAIVSRAAKLYLSRLLALAARQEQEQEEEGAADLAAPAAPALAYAEQFACALIANLGGGLGSATATEGTSAPVVAALSDELLQRLLPAFPALYHSQTCYCALLVQLQQEEGDAPMGQVMSSNKGLVWDRTKTWVTTAAEIAPLTTEALLHSFLTSSDSLPGTTSLGWPAGMPVTNSVRFAVSDGAPSGLLVGGGCQARVATQAAFRRAADLLQACATARRRQQMMAAGDGAYEGALGLTRKLHYTGYVQGLMNGRGSAAAAAAMLAQCRAARASSSSTAGFLSPAAAAAGAAAAPAGHSGSHSAMNGSGSAAAYHAGYSSLHNLRSVEERELASAVTAATAAATAAASVAATAGDGISDDVDSVASEATQLAVAEEIATQLELALLQASPLHPQESRLAVAQLSATALLAVEPDSFSYSQLGLRLLKALARAPLRSLTPDTMRLSQFCWCWVTVESPEVLVPLMSSLSSAWIWTLDQRKGLFSGGQQHQQLASQAAGGAHTELPADDADDSAAEVVHDERMLQAISSHFLWLSYLLETWAVVSRLRDGRTAAARTLYGRLLAASLQDPLVLSHHPAALGAYFRLLTLGIVFGRSCVAASGSSRPVGSDVLLLFDRILKAALLWFRSPPRYFARCTRQAAAEQVAALEAFLAELPGVAALGLGSTNRSGRATELSWPTYDAGTALHPVWGVPQPSVGSYVQLLKFLCGEELMRLRVWTQPLAFAEASRSTPQVPWREFVGLSWEVDPGLALSLLDHFPAAAELKAALEAQVLRHCHEPQVQLLPRAALLLATAKSAAGSSGLLADLAVWAPGSAAQGLQLLSGPAGRNTAVRSYAIKCLFNERPEKLVFFLPQLVQLLRGDTDGAIINFFVTSAAGSDLFAHQLIWALGSEARPPEEAFNPEVKRSGWQPPKDTGLWDIADTVRQQIEDNMSPAQQEYWQAEGGYFHQVTSLSGYLYKFSKDERRIKLQEALGQFKPPRQDLYLPTNPEARVINHISASGACMQSAAKVPILVAFDVEVPAAGGAGSSGGAGDAGTGGSVAGGPTCQSKMACIFKVGDDIRQDVLAIQVIKLLHNAFESAGLGLYLRPYGCLPTGYECGIIEVVPNTKSRAALGELSDRGLHDIFTAEFGAAGSPAFEKARENFIVSEAAYAVASYLLQAKDRHNGNIMLDDQGHIVHIDFGFILEISPGGNMGFESAAFKLSHEMTQVLDPGGLRTSPQLTLFIELVVRAYLAARTVAEPIIATVSLMADSGLPCFSRGAPVANLRQRFHLEMNDAQAAAFMRSQINDAYDKWTTGFYDYIQSLQNKIPY